MHPVHTCAAYRPAVAPGIRRRAGLAWSPPPKRRTVRMGVSHECYLGSYRARGGMFPDICGSIGMCSTRTQWTLSRNHAIDPVQPTRSATTVAVGAGRRSYLGGPSRPPPAPCSVDTAHQGTPGTHQPAASRPHHRLTGRSTRAGQTRHAQGHHETSSSVDEYPQRLVEMCWKITCITSRSGKGRTSPGANISAVGRVCPRCVRNAAIGRTRQISRSSSSAVESAARTTLGRPESPRARFPTRRIPPSS
jgi:hypothetical protein